jgi:glycosyltransferase involved in cell wall biosynthesis
MTETISVIIPAYRDWMRATKLASALSEQILPDNVRLEVVIVDDGSGEPVPDSLTSMPQVRVLSLPKNIGRSGARNEGFHASAGQYLVFIDSDCLPLESHFLAVHFEALRNGAIASTGHVRGVGDDFWDRYQQLASLRRQRQHQSNRTWSGSSQNLAVVSKAFQQIGGFDLRYREYGFEDRDLLVRLEALGTIIWTDHAQVSHNDALHLDIVAEKMIKAARFSASLFSKDHPQAYQALGYATIDVRHHPWLRLPVRLLGTLVIPLARTVDRQLAQLPFWLGRILVKVITACAFLYGSSQEDQ